MALGAVQPGYAGVTDAAYRQRNSVREGDGNLSFAAQMMENGSGNGGRVIGLAMFSCGDDKAGYSMEARYAVGSTSEEPVIQVTVNDGGKQVSYRVKLNEVNPWTASQLEMFALLSYTDDQGISDGGSFGSYQRLKVYSDNAKLNGIWEGNENWEDFVNAKHDWSNIVVRMADDYFRAGAYSQQLNAMNLNDTLSHYCIRHVDFNEVKIVDKSADMFFHYELNIPLNLRLAWDEALEEAGMFMDDELRSNMDSAIRRRFLQLQKENPAKAPLETALQAAREALQELGGSLASELKDVPETGNELAKQREVYQAFIRKLEKLQEEGNSAEAAEKSDSALEGTEDGDLMQQIRERMEELLAMIRSGDTEASFQIGNSTFTIKEWEKFLERFDDIEDAIRELMRERIEKRKEEAEEEAIREKETSSEITEKTGGIF